MTEPRETSFSHRELRCKCSRCQRKLPNRCKPESLARLQRVRDRFYDEFGKGLVLTSAYRCLNHPSEQAKVAKYGPNYRGGYHVKGTAFDIAIGWGRERQRLIQIAMEEGFTGFGYANSFLHIDDGHPVLTSWGYS
ncbi:hypothetical protein NM559_004069 [Vibrio alginolyticus]|nr:hypothetical protein [Vibrio alginolyticus]